MEQSQGTYVDRFPLILTRPVRKVLPDMSTHEIVEIIMHNQSMSTAARTCVSKMIDKQHFTLYEVSNQRLFENLHMGERCRSLGWNEFFSLNPVIGMDYTHAQDKPIVLVVPYYTGSDMVQLLWSRRPNIKHNRNWRLELIGGHLEDKEVELLHGGHSTEAIITAAIREWQEEVNFKSPIATFEDIIGYTLFSNAQMNLFVALFHIHSNVMQPAHGSDEGEALMMHSTSIRTIFTSYLIGSHPHGVIMSNEMIHTLAQLVKMQLIFPFLIPGTLGVFSVNGNHKSGYLQKDTCHESELLSEVFDSTKISCALSDGYGTCSICHGEGCSD